ncbi:MAG: hypothetical protein IIT98_05145 [Kiritimatiellae bacterium]|nr:hypothetical protein [Kiritimatiellia bacterium]
MSGEDEWYVRSPEGLIYGPTGMDELVVWAEEGRIEPAGFVSHDRENWIPAQLVPELSMSWVVEAEPGRFFGPFNRRLVTSLFNNGSIPQGANIYRRHDLPPDRDPEPERIEVVKEVVREVPVEVEKIVERIIEVEPPPRAPIAETRQGAPDGRFPPVPRKDGIFGDIPLERLAALEEAARRELSSWESFMGGK